MAAPVFQITINAVDKATAVAKRVNESIAKIAKPITDVKASVASFNKETGFDQLGKKFESVGKSAQTVARSVASIAPPLAAIVGVGSVAGIAAFATSWGRAAAEIANTSSVIGVTTTDLQRYRGAARVAGLSADAMTSSMQSLGDAFEDASAGRNNFVAGVLSDKGIGIHRLKDGTIDVVRGLHDVSAAASKITNTQAQRKFLDIFGLGGIQAMIRRGTIDQFVGKFDELHATMSPEQIAQGEKFNQSMIALDASVDKLKNSVGSALAPALGRAVDEFARLADDYGPKIAHWIDNVDWDKTAKSVAGVGEALGGVKGIALAIAAVTFAGPIAGLATLVGKATALSGILMPLAANPIVAGALGLLYSQGLNKGEGDTRLTQPGDVWDGDPIGARRRGGAAADSKTADVVNSLMLKGWSRKQAAGIAANLWSESMYNPGAIGDGGKAYGIAQWHADRQDAFKKLFGIDIRKSTLDQQLQFVDYELRSGSDRGARQAGNALMGVDNAAQAGAIVSRLYERPADADGEASKRAQAADSIDSSARKNYGTQKLEVTIHMPGAPHGTRASVHSNGEVMATGQIGHSLLMGP
ncbi:phage tail tip lysozyme [Burkholderia vietnamiensis]|uniref:phage tail tip lysozyme n=1 Tax=Burkholderia vietnamiensis TaxID=60552 RepID=UPI001CF34E55|nr:phage tail tip lysozyme [Burkholderia vietnamiensis]MCA8195480.1 phage tail-type lysozyme domain-containing protein [Burkholderia vietnamiensis]